MSYVWDFNSRELVPADDFYSGGNRLKPQPRSNAPTRAELWDSLTKAPLIQAPPEPAGRMHRIGSSFIEGFGSIVPGLMDTGAMLAKWAADRLPDPMAGTRFEGTRLGDYLKDYQPGQYTHGWHDYWQKHGKYEGTTGEAIAGLGGHLASFLIPWLGAGKVVSAAAKGAGAIPGVAKAAEAITRGNQLAKLAAKEGATGGLVWGALEGGLPKEERMNPALFVGLAAATPVALAGLSRAYRWYRGRGATPEEAINAAAADPQLTQIIERAATTEGSAAATRAGARDLLPLSVSRDDYVQLALDAAKGRGDTGLVARAAADEHANFVRKAITEGRLTPELFSEIHEPTYGSLIKFMAESAPTQDSALLQMLRSRMVEGDDPGAFVAKVLRESGAAQQADDVAQAALRSGERELNLPPAPQASVSDTPVNHEALLQLLRQRATNEQLGQFVSDVMRSAERSNMIQAALRGGDRQVTSPRPRTAKAASPAREGIVANADDLQRASMLYNWAVADGNAMTKIQLAGLRSMITRMSEGKPLSAKQYANLKKAWERFGQLAQRGRPGTQSDAAGSTATTGVTATKSDITRAKALYEFFTKGKGKGVLSEEQLAGLRSMISKMGKGEPITDGQHKALQNVWRDYGKEASKAAKSSKGKGQEKSKNGELTAKDKGREKSKRGELTASAKGNLAKAKTLHDYFATGAGKGRLPESQLKALRSIQERISKGETVSKSQITKLQQAWNKYGKAAQGKAVLVSKNELSRIQRLHDYFSKGEGKGSLTEKQLSDLRALRARAEMGEPITKRQQENVQKLWGRYGEAAKATPTDNLTKAKALYTYFSKGQGKGILSDEQLKGLRSVRDRLAKGKEINAKQAESLQKVWRDHGEFAQGKILRGTKQDLKDARALIKYFSDAGKGTITRGELAELRVIRNLLAKDRPITADQHKVLQELWKKHGAATRVKPETKTGAAKQQREARADALKRAELLYEYRKPRAKRTADKERLEKLSKAIMVLKNPKAEPEQVKLAMDAINKSWNPLGRSLKTQLLEGGAPPPPAPKAKKPKASGPPGPKSPDVKLSVLQKAQKLHWYLTRQMRLLAPSARGALQKKLDRINGYLKAYDGKDSAGKRRYGKMVSDIWKSLSDAERAKLFAPVVSKSEGGSTVRSGRGLRDVLRTSVGDSTAKKKAQGELTAEGLTNTLRVMQKYLQDSGMSTLQVNALLKELGRDGADLGMIHSRARDVYKSLGEDAQLDIEYLLMRDAAERQTAAGATGTTAAAAGKGEASSGAANQSQIIAAQAKTLESFFTRKLGQGYVSEYDELASEFSAIANKGAASQQEFDSLVQRALDSIPDAADRIDLENELTIVAARLKKGLSGRREDAADRYIRENQSAIKSSETIDAANAAIDEAAGRVAGSGNALNRNSFDEIADNLKNSINKDKGKLSANPIEVWAKYVAYGAAKIASGLVNFGKWAADLVKHLGPQIQPFVKELYSSSMKALIRNKNALKVAGGSMVRPLSEMKPGEVFQSLAARDLAMLPPELRVRIQDIDMRINRISHRMGKLLDDFAVRKVEELPLAVQKSVGKMRAELDEIAEERAKLMKEIDPESAEFSDALASHLKSADIHPGVVVDADGSTWAITPKGRRVPVAAEYKGRSPFSAYTTSPASTYAVWLGTVRDVLGESVVGPLRDAKRLCTHAIKEYNDDLIKILEPYQYDAAARRRLSSILENSLPKDAPPPTSQELKTVAELRKWLDDLYEYLGIEAKYEQNYFPRVAKFELEDAGWLRSALKKAGIKNVSQMDDNTLIEELAEAFADYVGNTASGRLMSTQAPKMREFFAKHEREGNLLPRERDVFLALHKYLHHGMQEKFLSPAINAVMPNARTMHETRRRVFADFVNHLMGRPTASEMAVNVMTSNAINNFYRHFGKEVQLGRSGQNLSSFIAHLGYMSTIAGNPFTALKNFTQQFLAIGSLTPSIAKNLDYWLRAYKMMKTAEGKDLLKSCWVLDQRAYQEGLEHQFNFVKTMRSGDDIMAAKLRHKYLEGISAIDRYGFAMFRASDMANVKMSYMMKLLEQLDNKVPLKEAIDRANKFVMDTQFMYGPDSPMLYKTPVGRHFGLLMSWPLNFFRLLHKLWKGGQKREVANIIGLMSGGSYILTEATGLDFSSTTPGATAKAWLPFAMVSGPSDSAIAMQQANAVARMAIAFSRDGTVQDREDAWNNFKDKFLLMLPFKTQVQRIARFGNAVINDGEIYDDKGRLSDRMSTGEMFRSLIGPTKEGAERHQKHLHAESVRGRYQNLRSKAYKAYFEGDVNKFNKIQAQLRKEFGKGVTRADLKAERRRRQQTGIERHEQGLPQSVRERYQYKESPVSHVRRALGV